MDLIWCLIFLPPYINFPLIFSERLYEFPIRISNTNAMLFAGNVAFEVD